MSKHPEGLDLSRIKLTARRYSFREIAQAAGTTHNTVSAAWTRLGGRRPDNLKRGQPILLTERQAIRVVREIYRTNRVNTLRQRLQNLG